MLKRTFLGILGLSLTLFILIKWNTFRSYSFTYIKIPAPSLQSALYNNAPTQDGFVMLPPGYNKSKTSYPVVYYLHGFGDNVETVEGVAKKIRWLQVLSLQPQKKFILIGFNGRHENGGSFYSNSPVTGNWEDFVIIDVKHYAEGHYKINSDGDCNMLFGFSMGGSGAVNLALRHADLYKHVFALSAGLFGPNTLDEAVLHWKKDNLKSLEESYAATFAYKQNLEEQPPYFEYDRDDSLVVALWESGLGDLENKCAKYLEKGDTLKSIRLEYGSKDYFWWVKDGAQHFSQILSNHNIEHEIHDHGEGHRQDFKQLNHVLKFINKNLCNS